MAWRGVYRWYSWSIVTVGVGAATKQTITLRDGAGTYRLARLQGKRTAIGGVGTANWTLRALWTDTTDDVFEIVGGSAAGASRVLQRPEAMGNSFPAGLDVGGSTVPILSITIVPDTADGDTFAGVVGVARVG